MFLGDWEELEEMIDEFKIKEEDLSGCNILVAWYSYEDYLGSAFVFFEKDGQLFEVHGDHCSCYGLEGQWEPEETTKESILKRIEDGELGTAVNWSTDEKENTFADELKEILKNWG